MRGIRYASVALLLLCTLRVPWALTSAYMIQFSDIPVGTAVPAMGSPDTSPTPAGPWLEQEGWQQVWPLAGLSKKPPLTFAGPPGQRYLQLLTEKSYYIFSRQIAVDPQALPWFTITWSVEQFPQGAALDLHERNDRALAILVSFGEKLPSPGLLPNVPRTLAFFWGEMDRVGDMYTCITPRNGPADVRLQCKYPHVKYIALQRGEAGSVQTSRVNLLEHFRAQFPDYWQQQQRAPAVVGVSFEASSHKTSSVSRARLYSMHFTASAETVTVGSSRQ